MLVFFLDKSDDYSGVWSIKCRKMVKNQSAFPKAPRRHLQMSLFCSQPKDNQYDVIEKKITRTIRKCNVFFNYSILNLNW